MNNTINTRSRRQYMASIPSDEIVTAAKDLTGKAYILLMYYYSKGDNWTWVDENMASDLGFTIRKIREYRNELIAKDYLLVFKGTITNVIIGREAVMKFKGMNHEED